MKRINLMLVAALTALAVASTPALAQVEFFIDAELPAADTATFGVSKVFVGPPENFIAQPPGTVNLDFGLLSLNTDGIFLPDPGFYWAIDVGSNGAGHPDVALSYTDTANPNGGLNNGDGLGGRATANFAEVVTNPDNTQTVNDITKVALGSVGSLPGGGINETQFADGFLRISVGIAVDATVANASPFTTLDEDGVYSGTLTITATFD